VVQTDLDDGLGMFGTRTFDVVILSQTLQVVRHPERALAEVVRVGRRGIVSFPNFAHWRVRAYLALRGRMPVSNSIPFSWYDTPNIHHTTIKDFRDLVHRRGTRITNEITLLTREGARSRPVRLLPNLFADTAVVVLEGTDDAH
jgi:methionine biosynthesis protein MetW